MSELEKLRVDLAGVLRIKSLFEEMIVLSRAISGGDFLAMYLPSEWEFRRLTRELEEHLKTLIDGLEHGETLCSVCEWGLIWEGECTECGEIGDRSR